MRPINADSSWTYPNGVLKNKLNIKNQEELDQIEEKIVNKNLKTAHPNFSKKGLINLHKHLYKDLYDFAGTIRDENVVYNGIVMCKKEIIDMCLTNLFQRKKDKDIINTLAYFYSELMIIFPFRDGNKKTIEYFLEAYTKKQNHTITFSKINEEKLNDALKYAFYYDTTKLIKLFKQNLY